MLFLENMKIFLLLLFLANIKDVVFCKFHGSVQTPNGLLKYEEEWGYVTVRKDAHTFWWLMSVKYDSSRPLIVWLQGGPGAASTGFGNFELFGPKDIKLKDRNSTWLQVVDIVFIDNPVGTGYSYVDSENAYTKNVHEIGADLLEWAKYFFKKYPDYQNRDFYIFSESYGGKMAAEFGKQLQDAIDANSIKVKLVGVVLGDSWISPMDFINTWPEYLYYFSFLDQKQLKIANELAAKCQGFVDGRNWMNAEMCFGDMQTLIFNLTSGIDVYNVLNVVDSYGEKLKVPKYGFKREIKDMEDPYALENLMEGPIRQKLKIIPNNVTYELQSIAVYNHQKPDFMKPNYKIIDNLLSRGINVTVYNGQLDLICDTLGVEKWITLLKWKDLNEYQNSEKISFGPSSSGGGPIWGYQKRHKNFQMFYVLRAGHMIALDVPWPALEVLKRIVGKKVV